MTKKYGHPVTEVTADLHLHSTTARPLYLPLRREAIDRKGGGV